MTPGHAVLIGGGRLGAGFVLPLLTAAGWRVTVLCRTPATAHAFRTGVTVRPVGAGRATPLPAVDALTWTDPGAGDRLAAADLVLTTTGPDALPGVGRALAAPLAARASRGGPGLTVLTVENHRRAPELLAGGLLAARPDLAPALGRRIGIAGVVAHAIVPHRRLVPGGVVVDVDGVAEAEVDATALVPGAPPADGSVPGLRPVVPFEHAMLEKLWLVNGVHATAAYLGRRAGCRTVDEVLARADLAAVVRGAAEEAVVALRAVGAPSRVEPGAVVARLADPALADPVLRVGRHPRRKLAPGDRLLGPAAACLAAGRRPASLVRAIAAALVYDDPRDEQACVLRAEMDLVGPAEVLATVCLLDPADELSVAVRHTHARAAEEARR